MDTTNDHAGRIPKQAFIISILCLLALCILATALRLMIRVRYDKQARILSLGDVFLLFGLCCMITSVGIIFVFIDSLYLVEAVSFNYDPKAIPNINIAELEILLSTDFIGQGYKTQKYSTISLVLGWTSIMSVKFSFLCLFKKLVDRVRLMNMYWWGVLGWNVIIGCYGVTVYFVSCPHFDTISDLQCGSGASATRTVKFSVSQIVLDVVGDLLILLIPTHLVLSINIHWTQKVALLTSLCLTIFVITITITKASGVRHGDSIDLVWEIYFQTVSAEVGLIMTAATAFRTFFVARERGEGGGGGGKGRKLLGSPTVSPTPSPSWITRFDPSSWTLGRKSQREQEKGSSSPTLVPKKDGGGGNWACASDGDGNRGVDQGSTTTSTIMTATITTIVGTGSTRSLDEEQELGNEGSRDRQQLAPTDTYQWPLQEPSRARVRDIRK